MTSGPSVAIEHVTAEKAKAMLEGNVDNRKMRAHRVQHYIGALQRGEWVLTGDAICLADGGRLLNGQHRLAAIMNSGRSANMLVLRNCPEASFAVMDQGMSRKAGDVFKSKSIRYANECAAVARMAWYWIEKGHAPGSHTSDYLPSMTELEKIYFDYKDEIDQSVVIGGALRKLYPAVRIALVDLVLRIEHGSAIDAFWDLVDPACPKGLDRGHPCRALRDHMMLGVQTRKMSHMEFAAKTIKTFNAWARGEEMLMLRFGLGETFPEIAKEIRAA